MQYDDYFLFRQAGTYVEQSTIIPSSIIKIFACAKKIRPPQRFVQIQKQPSLGSNQRTESIYTHVITASSGFTSMARVAPSHDGKDMDAGGARERGEP